MTLALRTLGLYNRIMSDIYTTTQFAQKLRESGLYPTASATSVMRWIVKGFIKGYRVGPGTRWNIPDSELDRILHSPAGEPMGGHSLLAEPTASYQMK
jgi:hypothetical protein